MKSLFDSSSFKISKLVTNTYSTSFSMGIKLLDSSIRSDIYSIYGFVRYADEIVDSFQGYDQELLLDEFEKDYNKAIQRKISLNPILNSFQNVVNRYELHEHVVSFLKSMRLDLEKVDYRTEEEYKEYIYGSADVVGLMCLKVFVQGDNSEYEKLKPYAMSLGSAFQKVNFLRDIGNDVQNLGRTYFPNVEMDQFTEVAKVDVINDVKKDFDHAFIGVKKLPDVGRMGVYLAYKYYLRLLDKLEKKNAQSLMKERIRVGDISKCFMLFRSYIRYKLNLL